MIQVTVKTQSESPLCKTGTKYVVLYRLAQCQEKAENTPNNFTAINDNVNVVKKSN